jgi:hypothetical protein
MSKTSISKDFVKQTFLNSCTWKFDKDEGESPLMKGEKVVAFKDPSSMSICVKFIPGR